MATTSPAESIAIAAMDDTALNRCLAVAFVLLKEGGYTDAADLLRTCAANMQYDGYQVYCGSMWCESLRSGSD